MSEVKEIMQLRPQLAKPESGAEPSLRELVEKYYAPHFPLTYEQLADQYVQKLSEMVK